MKYFKFPLQVPVYDSTSDSWGARLFETESSFIEYMEDQFKMPGKYGLKNTNKWKECAINYTKSCTRPNLEGGAYTNAIKGTSSYYKFWNFERDKCKFGVIYDNTYVPPFYYFYLNYCPFQDDVRGCKAFALVHDNDLYFCHYLTMCMLKGKHAVVLKARQKGYEIPYSEEVLTDKGFQPMGSLKVGDKVMTHTNGYANVIEIFEQGVKDVYEVSFLDGRKVRCGLEHLWAVYDKHAKKDKVLQLKELISLGLTNSVNKGKNISYRFAVPDIEAIEKPEQNLPIDPYILGCLLGDGTIKKQLKIASIDNEIISYFSKVLGNDYSLNKDDSNCNYNITYKNLHDADVSLKYNKLHRGIKTNPLIEELKLLNLWGKNVDTKFIPDIYQNGSINQRLELIRGLMDTDGYISSDGCMEFKNCAKQLVLDLINVLRSLGIKVSYREFPSQNENERTYYRVYIKTDKFNLFKLSRKASRFSINKKIYKRVPITEIKKLDYQENSRCITIDSPEQIYLIKDYIPTHNSLKIMSLLYWSYVWFEGTVNTIGAIDETKVVKSWRFLERYKSHCDKNTQNAMRRGPVKPKLLEWIERVDLADGGFDGNDSTIKGVTFQKSFDSGVGGAQSIFFYEEAGISPTMLKTIGYIRPALEKGTLTTGLIICSGALGELDAAEDLKEIFYNPKDHNFLSVINVWDQDPLRAGEPCGLFISEAYNMEGEFEGKPFYDKDGNSDVEHSMKFINLEKEKLKLSKKAAELVQLDLSQKITSPEEGFAARKDGFFKARLLKNHKDRLSVNKPKIIHCELYEDRDGLVRWTHSDKEPIIEFPFKGKADLDKRGAVCILELPQIEKGSSEPTPRMYFAGIDPIQTDITTTSESLFCIYIFKNRTRVKYKDPETGEIKYKYEGYKPVAWYLGRYDDRKQTNEQAEFLLRMYNAYALVENNVTSFIDHMRSKNLDAKYLMPSREAKRIWGEDVEVDTSVNRMYGICMAPNGKLRTFILNKIKEYLEDILDVIRTSTGEPVRTVYGTERISDIGLLNECIGYTKKENTDRLVSFGLALSACEMYINSGITSDYDDTEDPEEEFVPIKPLKGFFSKRIKFSH